MVSVPNLPLLREPDDHLQNLTSGLRVVSSSDKDVFCTRVTVKLADLVNRFQLLLPADPDFEKYLRHIITYINSFFSVFDDFLKGEDHADYLARFMDTVYRPFFDVLSKFIDMRKAGDKAVNLFETVSDQKFFSEGVSDFKTAADNAGGKYVHVLADQINVRCLDLLRSMHESRANIDSLTGVYSRRRAFELLRKLFDSYVSDHDVQSSENFELPENCEGEDSLSDSHDERASESLNDNDDHENLESILDQDSLFCSSAVSNDEMLNKKSLAVVFIDLDHFKQINDDFSHSLGDKVLRIVGRVLKESVRIFDVVGRFGGEEFFLALDNITLNEAVLVCSRLRENLDRAVRAECSELQDRGLTASVGISFFGDNGAIRTAEDLINAGDVAAYGAKKNGRDCIVRMRDGKLYKVNYTGDSFNEEELSIVEDSGTSGSGIVRILDKDFEITVNVVDGRIKSFSSREIPRVRIEPDYSI
ncbi:MAG: diguanylate cyclase [uncultured bacterium]|nr:MAG: diguanylate cyclase [uncultured bacterium]OGJ47766.1 MAG: hypothetical protein A2244_03935 [Candidatus Peregrinibacteria bacterium RIFOXYA2_FULL_41_18]OGJ49076.1 MAG: hypothetical protein A2344_05845 [Candidatus Peregrinibacteria bacterium RIFOXYB12_FULL_41_12]OGJ53020.1 MAG: hypothetical protein A2336_04300 [Candidatus Peregrinibacteria bacterium RIFOXYB2_FULL_41_88]OGJ53552.1 MAG: hypothetical protein A2448_04525 [Candidatus Peregrinibacteria bacterium RIFOXYC2_FULL_41_22]